MGASLDAATKPDLGAIKATVIGMQVDGVEANLIGKTMYVAFWRAGGCGRIYKNVCNYLRNKHLGYEIIVVQGVKPGEYCKDGRVRDANAKHFHRALVQVTKERLAIV